MATRQLSPEISRLWSAEPSPPRIDLEPFATMIMPWYLWAKHLHILAQALQALMQQKSGILIVIMPPRHGKSLLCSVIFPTWVLANWPGRRVMAVSHGASLAGDFARQARNLLLQPGWPFADVLLASDRRAAGSWDIAASRGGYLSSGIGGSITGRGADVLLIDDAIKNRQDALSEHMRDLTWEWFEATALPRLEPGGRLILIGTRWHQDDVLGRAIKLFGQDAKVLHLAARCVDPETDVLGRELNEPLWPERYDDRALAVIEQRVGHATWEAEYQGAPVDQEGAILHASWFPRYDRVPEGILYTIQSWDTAFKVGAGADWTACTTWGVTVGGCCLLNAFRVQVEFPELVRLTVQTWRSWLPRAVIIEDKASGQSLLQALSSGPERIPAVPYLTPKGKEERVHEIASFVEAGRVSIPRWAEWLDEYLGEITSFPLGAHDDYVDSTSQALQRIFGKEMGDGRAESIDYRQMHEVARLQQRRFER